MDNLEKVTRDDKKILRKRGNRRSSALAWKLKRSMCIEGLQSNTSYTIPQGFCTDGNSSLNLLPYEWQMTGDRFMTERWILHDYLFAAKPGNMTMEYANKESFPDLLAELCNVFCREAWRDHGDGDIEFYVL